VLWDDDEEDDADDDYGADQSADEELLQCDLSLDFEMGDREKSAAAATALEVAEEHALPLSSNPRSHSPSWQPHSPFQPRTLKRRQAAGGETWSAPVGKMEGERVTVGRGRKRKEETVGDGLKQCRS